MIVLLLKRVCFIFKISFAKTPVFMIVTAGIAATDTTTVDSNGGARGMIQQWQKKIGLIRKLPIAIWKI